MNVLNFSVLNVKYKLNFLLDILEHRQGVKKKEYLKPLRELLDSRLPFTRKDVKRHCKTLSSKIVSTKTCPKITKKIKRIKKHFFNLASLSTKTTTDNPSPIEILQHLDSYEKKRPAQFIDCLKSFQLSSDLFYNAKKFIDLYNKYGNEIDVYTLIDYLEELKTLAKTLSHSILNVDSLLKKLESEHEQILLETRNLLSNFNENEVYSMRALQFAITYCISVKRYDFLEGLVNAHQIHGSNPNKVVYHYLLDKVWTQKCFFDPPESEFAGSNINDTTFILAQNLRKIIDFNNFNIDNSILEILKKCCISLNFAAYIADLMDMNTSFVLENIIVGAIEDSNFPILIPCGCQDHSTTITVEITGPNKCRLYLNNTGFAVEKHYRWLSSNRYQTSLSIEDVPLSNVLKPELWKKVLASRDMPDMEYLYNIFINELGAGGVLSEASKNPYDYEQIQSGLTCAAQNPMAFLRSQLTRKVPGTFFERMGAYKWTKAHIITQIGNSYKGACDGKIRKWADRKLNKNKLELSFVNLSNDATFPKVYKAIHSLFTKLGKEIEMNISELHSFNARYQFLRASGQYLANRLLERSLDKRLLMEVPEISSYVLAVYHDKFKTKSSIQNLIKELKVMESWGNLGEVFSKVLTLTNYQSIIFDWFKKSKDKETQKRVLKYLVKDNGTIPGINKNFAELKTSFKKNKRSDLVEIMDAFLQN